MFSFNHFVFIWLSFLTSFPFLAVSSKGVRRLSQKLPLKIVAICIPVKKNWPSRVESCFPHQILSSATLCCSDPPECSEQKPSEWIVDSEWLADTPTFPFTHTGHPGYVFWLNPVYVCLGWKGNANFNCTRLSFSFPFLLFCCSPPSIFLDWNILKSSENGREGVISIIKINLQWNFRFGGNSYCFSISAICFQPYAWIPLTTSLFI